VGDRLGAYKILFGRRDGNRPLGRIDGRIILKRIFKKWDEDA
jgi:hypothetical protein